MRKWTRTAGLLFLAASSVYPDRVSLAESAAVASSTELTPAPQVTSLDDATASPEAGEPATQPVQEGASVTASQVNVNDIGTVEIHVNDANLVEVLRMLSLQSQKNIVASKEVRGTITANLYDVTVREALDAILRSSGYDYREKGNFIYVYTAKEIADIEKAARATQTEIFRVYYTPASNAVNMIKPVLSVDAQVSFTTPATVGIESGSSDAGGNSHASDDIIVVSDYPENLDRVRKVLKEVDRRPQQILVEAVILRATLQEDNELGVDFTALGGVDFSTLSGLGTAGTGTGLNQALSGQILNNPAAGGVMDSGYAAGQVGGGGLRMGVVKNNVGLFITALEGVTDTVVLANPKVLVLNRQKGEVHVGSEQGYRTAVSTETLTADQIQFLETGTRLIFRPYVGDSGNIRMEIEPEDSSGSVNAQGLPNKAVTRVTTNVLVKDGHTIVIGGLFRESSNRTRSGVPGLSNLPFAGPLFRRQVDSTVREEVIVLLTPHIIKDELAYAAASEEELKYAERLRVGVRRGMMPWGRERLAESSYQKAVAELSKENPDRQKALWHLNCATNLNPKFREAIELKARVSGEEITTVDNSSIRSFVRRQILAEQLNPPTTMPVDETDDNGVRAEATTQPSEEVVPTVKAEALAPATPPSPLAAATTQPAAPPQQKIATPAKSPFAYVRKLWSWTSSISSPPESKFASAPTTRPAEGDSSGLTTITELPVDEVEAGE